MWKVRANGAELPVLGFGTWRLSGRTARAMVEAALALGYRYIDTAPVYGNEREVGAAIRASGLPRERIVLATKVWPDRPGAPWRSFAAKWMGKVAPRRSFAPDRMLREVEGSLGRLGCGPVDLLMLHWPSRTIPLRELVAGLCAVRRAGLAREIGLSNCTAAQVREAAAAADEPLVCNQVEYHPFLDQERLRRVIRAEGMALVAHTPLAQGRVFEHPALHRIASARGRSVGQVVLRWLIQHDGVVAIPRSSSVEHVRANLGVFDFGLSDREMAEIAGLSSPRGRICGPAWAPAWDPVA